MIIDDFHVITMPGAPNEADPPLLVDADGMLPLAIPAQRLELVTGRRSQDTQFGRGMQLQQLAQRHPLKGTEAPGMLVLKELFGLL